MEGGSYGQAYLLSGGRRLPPSALPGSTSRYAEILHFSELVVDHEQGLCNFGGCVRRHTGYVTYAWMLVTYEVWFLGGKE
jgi:hypothetical protein